MVDFLATTEQTKARNMSNRHGIAAPWILGFYGVAAPAFMVGTCWAHWCSGSGSQSEFLLLPFGAAVGSITRLAAFWAFLASDGLAAAMLGSFGYEDSPTFGDIASDPDLAGLRLIGEPWDAGGAYQLGRAFPGVAWAQWNGLSLAKIRPQSKWLICRS
jgi:hypothetical protein